MTQQDGHKAYFVHDDGAGFEITYDHEEELGPLVLTPSKEEQDAMNGYGIGANSYLCKPVNFQHFGDAVAQLGL